MKNQNNIKNRMLTALTFAFLLIGTTGYTQNKIELSIGDTAPKLAYSKWIKGAPVTSLTGDKIYILEFWATWCKPCIESMPHLSALAEKYSDKMKVIAVNVSERTGDKPYESSLPSVETFVAQNANIMKFDVIADNNNREMYSWLKKGQIVGIPATIIVKNNQIIWIGHPMFLDKALAEIFDNTYDMAAKKQTYEKAILGEMATRNAYTAKMNLIDSELNIKNYTGAIKAVEKIIAEDPTTFAYKFKKFEILLAHFKIDDVATFLNATVIENKNNALALATHIAGKKDMPKAYDLVAIDVMKKALTTNTYYLDRLAFLQKRVGDFSGAATTQEQALVLLKEAALKNPDKISPDALKDFEEKIKKYKKASE